MARIVAAERQGQMFEQALDETRRHDSSRDDMWLRFAARPAIYANLHMGSGPSAGGEARFDLALMWTDEPAEGPALRASSPPDSPVVSHPDPMMDVARELGFGDALTRDELAARWREFVWRNHPDRQPADARESANARVAIANLLYDQARRAMTKGC